MKAANRVALNTAVLYGRMVLTMGITFYTTRLVLNALGTSDYGVFNLVAVVINMLSFLNTAMALSTQRYLSYHQGKNDLSKQKEVFTNSFFLHILIGLAIVIGLEFGGLFLFDGFLNIPLDRVAVARTIYHYMSITVFFTIISVPFNGCLISHENMVWVAFVNIIETLLKLGIAMMLYMVSTDKLLIYGLLTATISIISFFLYSIFCLKKYPECTLKGVLKPERNFVKELGAFAGWNLFAALCGMARSQGLALILNLFFGTVINAAYGIANQIGAQMLFFSNTMLRALNPQIMKSEGAGDRGRMLRLSMTASKFGFFLLALFAIPIMFEMEPILKFWLKNVPEYTVIFCRLILISSLVNQLTVGLQSAIQASGDIKGYQSIVGSILLLNVPVAFFALKYTNLPPYCVLISYATIELLACIVRMLFAKNKLGLKLKEYISRVFGRELVPVVIIVGLNYILFNWVNFAYAFIVNTVVSCFFFILLIYIFGLEQSERSMIRESIKGMKKRFYA